MHVCVCVCGTHPQRFEGLGIRQELEQRGGGKQQEGPVDGLSSLEAGQGELVEAVTRLVSHRRLRTKTRTKRRMSKRRFLKEVCRTSLRAQPKVFDR